MKTRRHPAALLASAVCASLVLAWAGTSVAGAGWNAGAALPGLSTGRIWAVASSPKTAGFAVAGTDHGVYVSNNSGVTWAQSGLPTVRVWAVGFDARDPTRVFAGTDGKGVFLSKDAGVTWTDVSAGLTDLTVRALAFGSDGVAAGTNHGVALSPDGTVWHDGGLDQYSISSVAIAANAPSLVLLAATDRGNLSNGYLFRFGAPSASWQALQSGLPSAAVVSSVAAGPLTNSVTKRPLVVTTSKGTFRSGDSGATWTASTGVPETLTPTTAVFSPLDPALVYAGADAGGSNGGDVLRSTDGGSSFTVADTGIPTNSRQVEALSVEQVTPPVVLAALDPSAGGRVYTEIDTTAPVPPVLVAEGPGQPIPSTLATPVASARPSATAAPSATPAPTSAVGQFFGSAFHWPVPLVFEVLLVLAIAYLVVRWRQRYYVEGPP